MPKSSKLSGIMNFYTNTGDFLISSGMRINNRMNNWELKSTRK